MTHRSAHWKTFVADAIAKHPDQRSKAERVAIIISKELDTSNMSNVTPFTKAEAADLVRAGNEIELFLRLASMRIEEHPDALPFKPVNGQHVLAWLRVLAGRYKKGEDITK